MRPATRASSISIAAKSGSDVRFGCSRLTATVREKPAGPMSRARCTVPIPPAAIAS
jgi:hypothetical protein